MDDTIAPLDPQSNLTPKTTFIYVLIDPRDNTIRYVGKTDNPKMRLYDHLRDRKDKTETYKSRWINNLKSCDLVPILQVIEEVLYECWEERERFWIEYYRSQGCLLTNTADGGQGGSFPPETRAKLSAKLKGRKRNPDSVAKSAASRRGIKFGPHTEEHNRKIGDFFRGKKQDPTHVEKRAALHRGMKRPPESVERSAAKHRGKKQSPEHIEKRIAPIRGIERKPFTEEHRHNIGNAKRGIKMSPESSAKKSAATRGRKQSPEHIAKRAASRKGTKMSSEARTNISLGIKKAKAMKMNPPDSPTLWD